ncbi:hypothetical protein CUC08_Gglean013423 [Alternaria sp. MG1]|nr:hypothetical protein CUC08_Gglean013423 [Alternaria sp. MG1]
MPVRWRPKKRFQVFIEENGYVRQMERKRCYEGRIFNDKGWLTEQINKDDPRELHDVEGTLEVQRQLLSKLAAHENQAIAELGSDMCHRRLEALKADTVQAIQKTWSQSSKSTTYRRSIYF